MLPYFPDGVAVYEVSQESVDSHKTYLLPEEPSAWFADLPGECRC